MDVLSIILALGLAFIAYKVLMGLMRVMAIVFVIGVTAFLWQQGVIG
ncbi:hypothetical protein INR77_10490 [Erythrobacter sp. SCSIO 43205]|nr:hypothetical protein [Erythrobacter sp. SCSIO 43205]UAB77243.1 hypothetical protein INR77_10490 [Erythrobacter sp. SCSIO 43205]